MISIRDADKGRLEKAVNLLDGDLCGIVAAQHLIQVVLADIDELMLPAPPIAPSIAPISEADKRTCYPERFSK